MSPVRFTTAVPDGGAKSVPRLGTLLGPNGARIDTPTFMYHTQVNRTSALPVETRPRARIAGSRDTRSRRNGLPTDF